MAKFHLTTWCPRKNYPTPHGAGEEGSVNLNQALLPEWYHSSWGFNSSQCAHLTLPRLNQLLSLPPWRLGGTSWWGLGLFRARVPMEPIWLPSTASASPGAPLGAQVPTLSPNGHPNPSEGRQKGFENSRIFEKFSADVCQPKTF